MKSFVRCTIILEIILICICRLHIKSKNIAIKNVFTFIRNIYKASVLSAQSTAVLDRCFAEYETADAAAILAELNADEEEI